MYAQRVVCIECVNVAWVLWRRDRIISYVGIATREGCTHLDRIGKANKKICVAANGIGGVGHPLVHKDRLVYL